MKSERCHLWGASFLPLLFINIQSYSARQPSISTHIERTHPCCDGIYRRNLARTLRQDYSFERLEREEEKKPRRSNGRETNGEIGTYARLAANLDISSMGANDGFDYAQAETETRL